MMARLFAGRLPLLATAVVCAALYVAAGLRYEGFVSQDVALNLLRDNSFLGLCALGETFVILAGGIDLSVGAMLGFTTILIATLIEQAGLHPALALPLALALGALFGAGQGSVIHFFKLPPFLVTLAGMFLLRGAGFMISLEAQTIRHPAYDALIDYSFDVFPLPIVIFLAGLAAALVLSDWTPFGRAVYALGGSESSARLMGLPIGRTKILVYTLSGLFAAAGGVVFTLYTQAGNPTAGAMLELDAIAAVVIGGTLLSGGIGHVFGTFLGVLTYGIIQMSIIFEGTLSSWWTRIAIGGLLVVFILLQRLIQRGNSE